MPEMVSQLLLTEIREAAERHFRGPIDGAVVTVPAYFTDAQRQATRAAALQANLNVHLSTSPTHHCHGHLEYTKRERRLCKALEGHTECSMGPRLPLHSMQLCCMSERNVDVHYTAVPKCQTWLHCNEVKGKRATDLAIGGHQRADSCGFGVFAAAAKRGAAPNVGVRFRGWHLRCLARCRRRGRH